MGGASMQVRQTFTTDATLNGVLEVKLACIHQANGRPARIPGRWRQALAGGMPSRAT